ncbi:MAG TPA: hypothetical protein VN879_11065 [Candidatus Acidoferrales bacterium]|nr:hypothetical protein [Candidatus Acidoferrales bacterium]
MPSEPEGIPAALDAAISGPADKDRACMKALLIPEARIMFVSLGADGAPSYRLETLDDWIARVKARGHSMLEEKQLKFHIERYGNIAHLWSSYPLHSDGKQVARGINSIQAIKEAGGWRVTGINRRFRVASCVSAKFHWHPGNRVSHLAVPSGNDFWAAGAVFRMCVFQVFIAKRKVARASSDRQ